jgi:hypothetical protein
LGPRAFTSAGETSLDQTFGDSLSGGVVFPAESVVVISINCWKISRERWRVASSRLAAFKLTRMPNRAMRKAAIMIFTFYRLNRVVSFCSQGNGFSPTATLKLQVSLPQFRPATPKLRRDAFDHEDCIFELKKDGFRALAYVGADQT